MLPFWETVSKQRSTLSKGRNFNAKLVASTLLLVWMGLKGPAAVKQCNIDVGHKTVRFVDD